MKLASILISAAFLLCHSHASAEVNQPTCWQVLERCEKSISTKSDTDQCIGQLQEICAFAIDQAQVPDAPKEDVDWARKIETLSTELKRKSGEFPFAPIDNSPEAQALAEIQNKCKKEFKFGYYLSRPYRGPTKAYQREDIEGKFDKQEDCERARLKRPDNVRATLGDADVCVHRYAGKPMTTKVYVVEAMEKNGEEYVKAEKKYLSMANCKSAELAAGKNALSKCKAETVDVCSSQNGINDLESNFQSEK